MFLTQTLKRTLSLALVIGAAACGGGGGDQPQDLVVGFDYPASTSRTLWAPLSIAPVLSGLQGKTPTCTADAALPAGLQLDSRTCVVSGTPTAPGNYYVSVSMTVGGYQGSIHSTASFTVPTVSVTLPNVVTSGANRTINVPFDQAVQMAAPTLSGYTPAAGDTVTWFVEFGDLPRGLTLDAATGVISGRATFGDYATSSTTRISARIIRNFVTNVARADYVTFKVTAPFSVVYPEVAGRVGSPLSFAPGFADGAPVAGDTFAFQYTSYTSTGSCLYPMPSGLQIAAATGVISGTVNTPAYGTLCVVWSVTRGSAYFRFSQLVPIAVSP